MRKADPSRNETVVGEHLKFERKDVWDMKWADVSFVTSHFLEGRGRVYTG